jgi:transcriptional regulator with XRE-family HTH domain
MAVAQRIRELREEKGLSVRGLAASAGISPSMLSQIETEKADPSLSTLRKLALALDVPLFYLALEEVSPPARLVKEADRRRVVFPKAGLEYAIVHSDFQKKMGIMLGTLAPGGATSDAPLGHAGEECLVMASGRMMVLLGQETMELERGDSLYFDSSVPHRLFNGGKEPCTFYLIITPPKF